MALVIEDGSIVEGANSFVTEAEFEAFAGSLPLPGGFDAEQAANEAIRFIVSIESRMTGQRAAPLLQDLPYPRRNVTLYGEALPETDIPKTLKLAQMQLMLDVARGVPLFPDDTAEQAVKREKVGPLETEYFGADTATTGGQLAAAWGYLSPLTVGFQIRTVRV